MAKKEEEAKVISIKGYKSEFLKTFTANLYKLIVNYIQQKCPNGEHLDTQNKDNSKDTIYADILELGGALGEERIEKYVYGLKVVEGKLYIATEYLEIEDEEKPIWTEEDFNNKENWSVLTENTSIIIVPTLCCIADNIEQY